MQCPGCMDFQSELYLKKAMFLSSLLAIHNIMVGASKLGNDRFTRCHHDLVWYQHFVYYVAISWDGPDVSPKGKNKVHRRFKLINTCINIWNWSNMIIVLLNFKTKIKTCCLAFVLSTTGVNILIYGGICLVNTTAVVGTKSGHTILLFVLDIIGIN